MIVHQYCDTCPLKTDMLADVRGRPCIFTGCPKAPKPRAAQGSSGAYRCPGCGTGLAVVHDVLDMLTVCPIVSPFYHCRTIILVKGTGSWIKKLVARFRLSKQVKQDRTASNLWP